MAEPKNFRSWLCIIIITCLRQYQVTMILHCNWWEFWSRDTDESIILSNNWRARLCPWKKKLFLAYNTSWPPMSVHIKFQPNRSSRLVGYRQHIVMMLWFCWSFAISDSRDPRIAAIIVVWGCPPHPWYKLWNHNGFSCVYMMILTSQTDLKITQATPSVIAEGGVQQSRPGELGLISKRGWRGAWEQGVSCWSTLLMRGGRASWASILPWLLFIFIDRIVFSHLLVFV